MRLTKKYKEDYYANPENEICKLDVENDSHISQAIRNKLGKLEDLMEKYGIESIEELEDTIKAKKALELAFGKHKG